jgi:O-antigen/teichoic acid export membrane protein
MTEPTPESSVLPPPSGPGKPSLDHSLVHGLAWTSAAKWGSQLLSWASTLIVARLLSPGDFGLLGMAEIYLGLVTLLSEFGLGTTVLALRDLTDEQVAQLHGFALLFGLGAFAISCLMAWPLGTFFHAPRLPAVVVVMSLTFIITSFRIIPAALLQRELRFRELATIDALRALVLAVVMVAFALIGFRYWTLVIGGLLSSVLATAQTLWLKRQRMARPRTSALRDAMTFSWHIIASRLYWYGYSNADFLVAGRLLGQAALGVYGLAWTLASIPVEKVTALVGRVTMPIFTAVQREPAELGRYLMRISEGVALLTFPASLGMALVAREFVLVFLGAKWSGAIVPLQVLALSVGLRSVAPLLSQVLNAIGDTRFTMYNSLLSAVVMPTAFYLMGTHSGTTGLALAWLTVYPWLVLMLYWRVFRRIELPMSHYLQAMWPALSSSAVMGAVVLGVRFAGQGRGSYGLQFGVQVALGALSYLAMVLTVHRKRLAAFLAVVRRGRADRRMPEAVR